jgi:hypothetical protein
MRQESKNRNSHKSPLNVHVDDLRMIKPPTTIMPPRPEQLDADVALPQEGSSFRG